MESKLSNGQLIVRYLLGDLPEEEQVRLEDRAFSDREYLRDIEEAENDLIDEYVRGALTETERQKFEQRFLVSAERQSKVEFARALARVVPVTEEVAQPVSIHWREALTAFLRGLNPSLQFSMAAAMLLFVFGMAWLFNVTRSLHSQVVQLQAEQQQRQQQEETLRQQTATERARNADLAAQLERERARNQELATQLEHDQAKNDSANTSFLASLFLPPGIARGNSNRLKLVIQSATRTARLRVGLERSDDFKSYRLELRAAQGQQVWTQDHLQPQSSRAGRILQLTIPASALNPGQYELTLKGVTETTQTEDVRYYYFDVLKK